MDGLGFCNSWNRLGSIPDICWCSFSGLCSLLSDLYGRQALKDARKKLLRWKKVPCRGLLRNIEIFVPFHGGFAETFRGDPSQREHYRGDRIVGSGGGFSDCMVPQSWRPSTLTDRERLLFVEAEKMPRSSEKGLTCSKVAQFEAE